MFGPRLTGHRKLSQSALYTSVVVLTLCNLSGARADWAESMGIGQISTNLGGAVTATASDYDVFYTNPAGAANFNALFIGTGLKVLDTRTLSITQSGAVPQGTVQSLAYDLLSGLHQNSLANLFQPPANGLDLSPDRTLPGAAVAVVPSFGIYAPIPGYERIVFGVGMGSPFLVSADFGNDKAPGNYGQFDANSAGMVIVETSPTVAVKVTDSLNLGASLGITTFKYVQISSAIGAPSFNVPNALSVGGLSIPLPSPLGGLKVPLGAGSIGSMSIQTGSAVKLPGIEPAFDTGPTDVSYTLGAQYKFTDKLSGGVTYRSKTPETFTGTATANINQLGLQDASGKFVTLDLGGLGLGKYPLSIGPYKASDRFTYKVELPSDVQGGLAYSITPAWRMMADLRWTNWSDAKGFGTPSVIQLSGGTINPGAALTANACTSLATLIKGCNPVSSILKVAGVQSAPIKSITVNYHAQDTISVHLGTAYKLTPQLEIQAGYVYDPSFMPADSMDLITLSSDRHIFSLGGTYTIPTASGSEWAFTAGGQVALYEDRHISAGQSQTAGGINGLQGMLSNSSNLSYGSNNLGGFDIGGYVWSAGASVSYKWGSNKPQIDAAK
jgi:long-chain fatty acid transport protein